VYDTQQALSDMAKQIRGCRMEEGLTLQQLSTRSGVAASTIHKVESGQMVPTVAILLKIARGLGRRPDELVRDQATLENAAELAASEPSEGASSAGRPRLRGLAGRSGCGPSASRPISFWSRASVSCCWSRRAPCACFPMAACSTSRQEIAPRPRAVSGFEHAVAPQCPPASR
jgi:transcriptional regulator with XRE-family HTH domain